MDMKKYDVVALGELLIDLTQNGISQQGNPMLEANPGGAPCNVLALLSKLGHSTGFIGKVGCDGFGEQLCRAIQEVGIDHQGLCWDEYVHTTLAVVHTKPDGDRDFSFYRNPSADLLYSASQIDPAWFRDAFALHFCSVSLVESPMKAAHDAAIHAAGEAGAIISFDPNLRFPLWPDRDALRRTVLAYLPRASVLKISDEELAFLTGAGDIEAALPQLFAGDVQLVLYTCGGGGAHAYTRSAHAFAQGSKVQAVDTTGAGDGFIGSFLWQLSRDGVTREGLAALTPSRLEQYLRFSNRFCGLSVQRYGAIDSYPSLSEMETD